MFGHVNPWWVFSKVSLDLDSLIFMAEVEKIGYKRTTKKEKITINELYRTNKEGEILVDDNIKETVLDYVREINWEDEQ